MTDLALPISNPVLVFALVMLMILVAPVVFGRFKLPGIVGLILAGVIVGPNATGLLARDQTFILLGTVGLLYIMFLAGLEMDLDEFKKARTRSLVFGLLTFSIPQGVGTLVGLHLLGFDLRASILLASMFASHTLLTYPGVSRLGLARNEAVTVAVAGTIITDMLALLVLAVIAASARGELNTVFWVSLPLLLTLYLAFMFWVVPRISRWFFRHADDGGPMGYVFVLSVVFTCSFLAELAGVEAIIGAFVSGLVLNRLIPGRSSIMNRIGFVGNALFIPFFLISVGMLVDLRMLLIGSQGWKVAIAMVLTVTATKWAAAFLTQRLFRYRSEERQLIFGLSVPQAAATLAAVLIGFELGIFNEDVLNGSILMILGTCVLGSWAAERSGRKLAQQEELKLVESSPRTQRILVPVANPASIELLLDLAILIKDSRSQEPLWAMSVLPDDGDLPEQLLRSEVKFSTAVDRALATDTPVRISHRVDLSPARGILRAISELRITQLIIGWNAEVTTNERIFGTILDHLLTESRLAAWVCHLHHPLNTMQRLILVIPPNVIHEPGFADLLLTVNRLSSQIGAPAIFHVQDSELPHIRLFVAQLQSAAEPEFRKYSEWAEMAKYNREFNVDDLIVLISARAGTIGWNSYLDDMPRFLAHRFPGVSFIIAYPEIPPDTAVDLFPRK